MYSVPCSTLESRNPTWAVSAAFLLRSAPDSPHPLGAKRPSIYSLILDEGAVSFLLSGYPFRTVPRKEGPPRTSSTPRRSRSSFSFPPGLLISFSFILSLSFSSSLLPSPALARQSKDPDEGSKKEGEKGRERQREKEGAETGGDGRKAGGEGGAGGLERTRSPFTLLPGLGRYLSTVRVRTHMCISVCNTYETCGETDAR